MHCIWHILCLQRQVRLSIEVIQQIYLRGPIFVKPKKTSDSKFIVMCTEFQEKQGHGAYCTSSAGKK